MKDGKDGWIKQKMLILVHAMSFEANMTELTRSADAVRIEGRVSPDGFTSRGVHHGPHHLVKRLVGVAT